MKHHHVPRFLLESWASEKDGKIEVFRLDLQGLHSSRHTPKYTGYEEDLYALSETQVAGIERQALESDFLQEVDSRAAHVLHKMEDTGLKNLTDEDQSVWLYFVMLFRWRNPDAVSVLDIEGSKRLKASLDEHPEQYDEIAEALDPPTLAEMTEINFPGLIENFGKLHLPQMSLHPIFLEKVGSMRWWLYDFSDQNKHLLLADRPCIFTTRLDDPDLVFALPIGPWKAFLATKSNRASDTLKQQRRKDLLVRINESSMGQAHKYIWALDVSPRRFISNRLYNRRLLKTA